MVSLKKSGIILEPTENKFENHGVLNPAVMRVGNEIHLFYRATNKANYSTIGHCILNSPTEVAYRSEEPIIVPVEPYESHGVEDPRIVCINGTFYITYTAYDGQNALGALITSNDLKTFHREGIVTPQLTYHEFKLCIESCNDLNEKYLRFVKLLTKRTDPETVVKQFLWDKDVVLFPRKINGKFALLHRIYPDIQIVYFNDFQDLTYPFWKEYLMKINDFILLSGKADFEASYIGGGCPPIETPEGWLLIYHGVEDSNEGYIYHTGVSLMDLDDPTKEIGRLQQPLFSPELEWEKTGVVNNVVFPTGAIIENELLYIYYGAADKRIGVVSVNLDELIQEIKKSTV
jgi:predicted GH43/DUF377 family glycosyl hydrolase